MDTEKGVSAKEIVVSNKVMKSLMSVAYTTEEEGYEPKKLSECEDTREDLIKALYGYYIKSQKEKGIEDPKNEIKLIYLPKKNDVKLAIIFTKEDVDDIFNCEFSLYFYNKKNLKADTGNVTLDNINDVELIENVEYEVYEEQDGNFKETIESICEILQKFRGINKDQK